MHGTTADQGPEAGTAAELAIDRPRGLRIKTVMRALDISERTLYRLLEREPAELDDFYVEGCRLITPESLDAYVERQRARAAEDRAAHRQPRQPRRQPAA